MRAVLLLAALVGFAGLTALATPAFAQGGTPRTTSPSGVRTSSDRGYGSAAQGQPAVAAQATADVTAIQGVPPSVQDLLMQAMGQAAGPATATVTVADGTTAAAPALTPAPAPVAAPEHVPGEPIRIRPAAGNEREMLRPAVAGDPIRLTAPTASRSERD